MTVERQPCKTPFAGRPVEDFCDECSHVLLAHTKDRVCSVCAAIDTIVAAARP